MGNVIPMLGGGGGTGSDDVTATKDKVLSGYTAVTKDSNDEAVAGTMPNRNNINDNGSARLLVEDGKVKMYPKGGYYAGYSDGSPYYVWDTQALVAERGGLTAAKLLAGQSAFGISGTATNDAVLDPQYLLTGYSGYDDGVKKNGTMANQGAKTSALNCGGSYTIPKGYHNGSGKVTANSLASQTSANSGAGDIRSGKTAWVNGSKITGTLAVQSAISFSAAALSYDTIRISWKNPARGPWQGVFIQMSTSGYPGTGGGSRVYTGAGTNPNQANGNNYIDIGGLSPGTTYYFTCTSYCDSLGWGASNNIQVSTSGLMIWNRGYNPYDIYCPVDQSGIAGDNLFTYRGKIYTSDSDNLRPFKFGILPNIPDMTAYTALHVEAEGSTAKFYVYYTFGHISSPRSVSVPYNNPLSNGVNVISIENAAAYNNLYRQYGAPIRIEIAMYNSTSESDGELYSISFSDCKIYKMWYA